MNISFEIGIIGEGKMGSNIFYYLNDFDYPLTWICSKEADIEKIQGTFNKKIKRLYKNGLIDQDKFIFRTNTTIISKDLQHLSDCKMVIESIVENQEEKFKLFVELNKIIDQNCIFASNSSSITPSKLIPGINRKDKFVGLHFFYPIALKNIVEVIITKSTAEGTLSTVKDFLQSINRQYIVIPEEEAFLLNKIFLDFQAGAFRIHEETNLSFEKIDGLIKKNLFPIGVFEFFDSVGIDVMLTSVENYVNELDKTFYKPLINKFKKMCDSGKLGIKTKSGFYDYGTVQDHGSKDESAFDQSMHVDIITRLQDLYLKSVIKFWNKVDLSGEELDNAVKEYIGIEKGPISLAKELGYKID